MEHAVEDWVRRTAERRFKRELAAWDPRPELRFGPLFRLRRPEPAGGGPAVQNFRSLIQVNFYRRPG